MQPVHNAKRVLTVDVGARFVRAWLLGHTGVYVDCLSCASILDHEKMCDMDTSFLIDPAEALAPFGDADVIPLPDVGDYVGMTRDTRAYVIRKGLVQTATGPGAAGRGRQGSYVVTRNEAMLIIVSAALAATIGVAIATVIKALRNSGASITADTVMIPLSGLKTMGKGSQP